jgi:hypothetical protein
MIVIEQQFEVLKTNYKDATLQRLADGSYLISIPSIELPQGWNKRSTEVKFIAPVGYPLAQPDCFWTDLDLKLANGNPPQNTGSNPIPNYGGNHWWFSWHLGSWNPNVDNLLTYLNVIKRRLHDPR